MHAEQVIAAIHFEPLLPVWTVVSLALLLLAVSALAFWRRGKGAVLRALASALLVLWLLGPRLEQETRERLSDIGLLVLDQTASMQIGDRTPLAEKARAAILDQASRQPGLELRTITVPEGGSAGTQLFGAIAHALADIPQQRFAGTIAITDGQIHDLPDTPPGGMPLNLLIPARGEETDRHLRVLEAPGYGIVGKPVTVRLVVEDKGTSGRARGTTTLTIRRDGEPPRTEIVPVGVEQRIDVPITRAGPTVVELAASELPGEISPLNNRAVIEVIGVRDRLRVLLVSGEPTPGERAWRRLLKADPSVDLVHFTILRPPEKDDLTPLNELALIAFPVRELFQEKIGEFDLIILDRFQNRGLLPMPYLANIATRVRQGGALLMTVGPEFASSASLAATPLGAVLPARPARANAVVNERFRPWVTALGQRHPVTEGLAGANPPSDPRREPGWGTWYRYDQATDVAGSSLMQTPDGQPLLLLNRVGKGRVAMLMSDQIWLWSRGHDGGGPQAEVLRRIAHWLMQEPALEENALTARVVDGQLQVERRSTDPMTAPTATVTAPDGSTSTLALAEISPGRATASMQAPMPGAWQVTDGVHAAFAATGTANPLEIDDLRATASVTNALVRASGGGVHWLGTLAAPDIPVLRRTESGHSASGNGWVGLEQRRDHVVTGVASLALIPAWLALPLMAGLLVWGWRSEGR